MGFDFQGAFTQVTELRRIGYTLDDKRRVRVNFGVDEWGVTVRERFDTEPSQDPEMQRLGWQAILDHLAAHVQALK